MKHTYKRCDFIVNPKSGSQLDTGCVKLLRDWLKSNGCFVNLQLTRSLAHAGELAQYAVQQNSDCVVVVGGDGTVRTVLEAMSSTHVPILIIPSGTENLLACELGLDGSLECSRKTMENGIYRYLDLGQANNRRFMAIAGIGFDAEVVQRVHSRRTGHITPGHYIWPICRTFWEHKFPHLDIEADGKTVCNDNALAFVSNISRYAIGLGIATEADCSDGLLDLCIYRCNNRLRLLCHSALTIFHSAHKSRLVTHVKCRHIKITNRQAKTQLDGDPGPDLPIKIEIIPSAVKVLTPPPPPGMKYHPPLKHYHLKRWLLR